MSKGRSRSLGEESLRALNPRSSVIYGGDKFDELLHKKQPQSLLPQQLPSPPGVSTGVGKRSKGKG